MIRLDQFGITIPCSTTYFLEVGARLSLKVATKGSLRGKKTEKFRFLSCSATYFLEVGESKENRSSSATKKEIRNYESLDFKVAFLNQKRRSATQKIEVFLRNLKCSCLFQIHVF